MPHSKYPGITKVISVHSWCKCFTKFMAIYSIRYLSLDQSVGRLDNDLRYKVNTLNGTNWGKFYRLLSCLPSCQPSGPERHICEMWERLGWCITPDMDSLQIRRIEFPGNHAWKETQCSQMFIDYWALCEDVPLGFVLLFKFSLFKVVLPARHQRMHSRHMHSQHFRQCF